MKIKTTQLQVRVSVAFKEKLRKAAEAAGTSMSDYVETAVLEKAGAKS